MNLETEDQVQRVRKAREARELMMKAGIPKELAEVMCSIIEETYFLRKEVKNMAEQCNMMANILESLTTVNENLSKELKRIKNRMDGSGVQVSSEKH